jgi:DtxR family Mn-dependent transcriptional regulator
MASEIFESTHANARPSVTLVPKSATKTNRERDEAEISPNVEMYLKTLVRLYDGDTPVPSSAIAKELSVTPPSAYEMLKRLDNDGFVSHEGRHGVIPTERGARLGALTLRRQLLAERLLVDQLGLSWEIAAGEACRLEHAISPVVERGLAEFLRMPTTCPHGHPIPHEDGTMWHHERAEPLSALKMGVEATVVAVPHDMPEILTFLADIDLRPGAKACVVQRDRLVGLLTLTVDGGERVVSLQLANSILMQPAS